MKPLEIYEVGPRDGFQSLSGYIPLEVKTRIIGGLLSAGIRHIQITSFVSPKAVPQMRDARELAAQCTETYPQADFSALIPNLRGAEAARESGIGKVSYVVSLSESHNLANIGRTHAQSLAELKLILDRFPDMQVCLDLATAFGCPFEGAASAEEAVQFLRPFIGMGITTVNLCDTIGIANPAQVRRTIAAVKAEFPRLELHIHIHDTRNMGMVNTLAAVESGVTNLQSTLGGLGGCPYAPGASGNLATEDLVFMLTEMGYRTSIDLPRLVELAKDQAAALPEGKYSGHLHTLQEIAPAGKKTAPLESPDVQHAAGASAAARRIPAMNFDGTIELIARKSAAMRRDVIEMGYAAGERGAHFGPALSSIEITACLFFGIMHHDPRNPAMADRDRFVMSKGHACLSYYAALVEAGYIPRELMATFKADNSFLAGHPSLNLDYGLEVSTGSLGNGFAVACGMAMAARIKQEQHLVFCLVGDGECNEGLIWEAAMNAAKNRLDNLIAIVDRNGVQLAGKTSEIMDVDVAAAWRAFGWAVREEANGNDSAAMYKALQELKRSSDGRPQVLIADTIKGRGISFMEDSLSWHARPMEREHYEQAIAELGRPQAGGET